jgi:hypothetical protein
LYETMLFLIRILILHKNPLDENVEYFFIKKKSQN